MGKQEKTLRSADIPDFFIEPGIVGGYRRPGISYRESIVSIFHLHNETLNIWTHLGAVAFFSGYTYLTSLSIDLFTDEALRPLLYMFLASCLYPTTSTLAHTFNSMTALTQHVGFMLDYYGICVYAFVTATSNLSYSFPNEWKGTMLEHYYIPATALCMLLTVTLACKSRFIKFGMASKLMRLNPFILTYIVSMSPLVYRIAMAYSPQNGTFYYYRHFVDAFFTFTFYSSHFPEIAFPGYFNLFFHSHQIFHVLVAIGTYFKLKGLMADINSGHSAVEISNCTLIVSAVTTISALITVYYIRRMYLVQQQNNGGSHNGKDTRMHSTIPNGISVNQARHNNNLYTRFKKLK